MWRGVATLAPCCLLFAAAPPFWPLKVDGDDNLLGQIGQIAASRGSWTTSGTRSERWAA